MPALGRAAFLGQLYNGKTEQLLNSQLFAREVLSANTLEDSIANTSLSFTDVKTQSDRSKSLKITAEISLSIMSGMIKLSGSGEYVDASKSNVSSHEISAVCTVQKKNKRLDVGPVVTLQKWTQVSNLGATHVVTAIRMGGTLVANIVQKDSNSEDEKVIKGSFSASFMEGMGAAFSASGSASINSTESGKDLNNKCDFKIYGDWSSSQTIPTTIGEVFQLIKDWPNLVGDGVPCTITLTPISQFVDTSPESLMLYELEQHKIMSMAKAYDDFFALSGRRARIVARLESGVGEFCPTFLNACVEKKLEVEQALGLAREELTTYLVAYRTSGPSALEGVETFLARMRSGFTDGILACNADDAKVDLLNSISTLATAESAPLASVGTLRSYVTSVGSGAVGVVIVPPAPKLSSATNTFNLLIQSIRKWREDEDKKIQNADGTTPVTKFSAFYADAEFETEILSLEGTRGVVQRGLDQAKASGESCFIHYGLLPGQSVRKEYDWSLLNNEGWGFLTSQDENYYYVGQVKGGLRHGRGTVTYADGSTYTGDWWKDMRHGEGKLSDADGNVESNGVFIENIYRSDGIVLKVSVYRRDQVMTASIRVPLRKYDSTPSHVLRIGEMMGWLDRDEFRLELISKTRAFTTLSMEVRGKLLKPGTRSDLYTASWPLDQGLAEIKATMK
ncbi:hypothetical protein ONZ45_g1290 [Pleurotus djamor]|nr:hypothetical protein ONZ45_g1290 [Pleurotus djamor]